MLAPLLRSAAASRRGAGRCLRLSRLGGGSAVAPQGEQPSLQPLLPLMHWRGLSSLVSVVQQQQHDARAASSRVLAGWAGGRGQQRRSMFIQTEATPNPESLKYMPGQVVLDEKYGTGMYFRQGDKEVNRSPLAKKLFKIPGVVGVFLGRNFITITKTPDIIWQNLNPEVFATVMDHYAEGGLVVSDEPILSDTTILDTDDEVVAMIKELIEARIRPAVQEDGGDIFYAGFDPETGIVSVQLAGSCSGCPSSSITLKNGVENMLMHYIPEVTGIQQVEDEELKSINEKEAKSLEERLAKAGIPMD